MDKIKALGEETTAVWDAMLAGQLRAMAASTMQHVGQVQRALHQTPHLRPPCFVYRVPLDEDPALLDGQEGLIALLPMRGLQATDTDVGVLGIFQDLLGRQSAAQARAQARQRLQAAEWQRRARALRPLLDDMLMAAAELAVEDDETSATGSPKKDEETVEGILRLLVHRVEPTRVAVHEHSALILMDALAYPTLRAPLEEVNDAPELRWMRVVDYDMAMKLTLEALEEQRVAVAEERAKAVPLPAWHAAVDEAILALKPLDTLVDRLVHVGHEQEPVPRIFLAGIEHTLVPLAKLMGHEPLSVEADGRVTYTAGVYWTVRGHVAKRVAALSAPPLPTLAEKQADVDTWDVGDMTVPIPTARHYHILQRPLLKGLNKQTKKDAALYGPRMLDSADFKGERQLISGLPGPMPGDPLAEFPALMLDVGLPDEGGLGKAAIVCYGYDPESRSVVREALPPSHLSVAGRTMMLVEPSLRTALLVLFDAYVKHILRVLQPHVTPEQFDALFPKPKPKPKNKVFKDMTATPLALEGASPDNVATPMGDMGDTGDKQEDTREDKQEDKDHPQKEEDTESIRLLGQWSVLETFIEQCHAGRVTLWLRVVPLALVPVPMAERLLKTAVVHYRPEGEAESLEDKAMATLADKVPQVARWRSKAAAPTTVSGSAPVTSDPHPARGPPPPSAPSTPGPS